MVFQEFFGLRGLMLISLITVWYAGYGMEMREVGEDVETPLNLSPLQPRQRQPVVEYSSSAPWVTSMNHAISQPTRSSKSGSMKKSASAPEIHASTNYLLQTYAANLNNAEAQKNFIEALKGVLGVITTNQGIAHDQTSTNIAQTNAQVGQEAWKTRLWGIAGALFSACITIIPQFIAYYGTGVDCNGTGGSNNSTMSS